FALIASAGLALSPRPTSAQEASWNPPDVVFVVAPELAHNASNRGRALLLMDAYGRYWAHRETIAVSPFVAIDHSGTDECLRPTHVGPPVGQSAIDQAVDPIVTIPTWRNTRQELLRPAGRVEMLIENIPPGGESPIEYLQVGSRPVARSTCNVEPPVYELPPTRDTALIVIRGDGDFRLTRVDNPNWQSVSYVNLSDLEAEEVVGMACTLANGRECFVGPDGSPSIRRGGIGIMSANGFARVVDRAAPHSEIVSAVPRDSSRPPSRVVPGEDFRAPAMLPPLLTHLGGSTRSAEVAHSGDTQRLLREGLVDFSATLNGRSLPILTREEGERSAALFGIGDIARTHELVLSYTSVYPEVAPIRHSIEFEHLGLQESGQHCVPTPWSETVGEDARTVCVHVPWWNVSSTSVESSAQVRDRTFVVVASTSGSPVLPLAVTFLLGLGIVGAFLVTRRHPTHVAVRSNAEGDFRTAPDTGGTILRLSQANQSALFQRLGLRVGRSLFGPTLHLDATKQRRRVTEGTELQLGRTHLHFRVGENFSSATSTRSTGKTLGLLTLLIAGQGLGGGFVAASLGAGPVVTIATAVVAVVVFTAIGRALVNEHGHETLEWETLRKYILL
ncbi:MAG: hypothetical protein AAGF12_33835, partial [Myxococcota bacterium]